MSQPIKTGDYYIYWFSFIPEGVLRRPVGIQLLSDGSGPQVVVLTEKEPPQEWHIEKLDGDERRYIMRLGGQAARPHHATVHVNNDIPPFEWYIIRLDPQPPPIGDNVVTIGVGPPLEDRWFVELFEEKNEAAVPVLVVPNDGTNFQLVKVDY